MANGFPRSVAYQLVTISQRNGEIICTTTITITADSGSRYRVITKTIAKYYQ